MRIKLKRDIDFGKTQLKNGEIYEAYSIRDGIADFALTDPNGGRELGLMKKDVLLVEG